MALSTDTTDIAYLAGRYFAVICHAIGYDKVKNADHANCSTRPSEISRLHTANLHKITRELDDIIAEIFEKVPSTGFPSRLSMDQQAQYAMGHYHQKSALQAMQADVVEPEDEEIDAEDAE